MTTRSERISYQMIRDSLLASDLIHSAMIDEYFFQEYSGEPIGDGEIAAVAAQNRLIAKALVRMLDTFWKPEDL